MEGLAKLRDNRGEIAFKLGIILVAFSLFLFMGVQVYRIYYVLDASKERANEAVLAAAAVNVSEFYGGAREGDGQARRPLGDYDFESAVSTSDVLLQLAVSLGAEVVDDNTLYKEGNYTIRDLDVRFLNAVGDNLNFMTTFTVAIEYNFGGRRVTTIERDMEVNTTYEPKF